MMIEVGQSYNLIFDDTQDVSSGGFSTLLAHVIVDYNLSHGLELGTPWLAEKGVISSNTVTPNSRMCVISLNKSYSESKDLVVAEDTAELIQFLFKHNYNASFDIRRIKALCKGFKKNQTYRKYLYCQYSLLAELEEGTADLLVKDMLSYGLPFYIKVKKTIECLTNLTAHNLRTLLFYRTVWGEETLKSVVSYLTNDKPMPDYIVQDFKEAINSNIYKINLINFGIAVGSDELNYFITRKLYEAEGL
jgi:hypothetical protein